MPWLNNKKTFAVGKAFGKGAEISEEQLVKISKYALEEIPADQLYVRKIRLAHNAIDRDEERFNEDLLKDFVATLPGKSLLIGHQWGPPGQGVFFDAWLEEKSLSDARQVTGEKLELPEGMGKVTFLMSAFYTVKTSSREDLLTDIDAGIVRHASIGFNAEEKVPVRDSDDNVLFREYRGPGEALEGSLVWLGAQPGATTTKAAGGGDSVHIENKEKTKNKKEEKGMFKKFLVLLGLSEEASDEAGLKALNEKLSRLKFVESIIAALGGDNVSVEGMKELKSLAAAGKGYKKSLVDDLERYERMLDTGKTVDGDGDAPEKVKARKESLMKREGDDLASDVSRMKALVFEKFPDESSIDAGSSSEDQRDNGGADGKKKRKSYRKTA